MPLKRGDYPASMQNLPKAVREKAVSIANALLEDHYMDEGIAIATGIKRAIEWAAKKQQLSESTALQKSA
jgi:uncharacterized protein YdaT